jgi:gamma-glutamyltranspeptidase/glutathione hydrolase
VPPAPEGASGWTDKKPVAARRFLTATANPHATDAAYAMLARGGSAVDATIAAQLVLGLTEPQSSGLGGGRSCSCTARARTGCTRTTVAKPRRPPRSPTVPRRERRAARVPRRRRDRSRGGVPGTLRVLELAHAKHGKLPWSDLFTPAIALAESGFAVSPRLATAIAGDASLARDPRASKYFFADGKPLAAGALLRNPPTRQRCGRSRARARAPCIEARSPRTSSRPRRRTRRAPAT